MLNRIRYNVASWVFASPSNFKLFLVFDAVFTLALGFVLGRLV